MQFWLVACGAVDGELLADAVEVGVAGAVTGTTVQLSVPQGSLLPGQEAALSARVSSPSLVAFVATDKSLSFLNGAKRLDGAAMLETALRFSSPIRGLGVTQAVGVEDVLSSLGLVAITTYRVEKIAGQMWNEMMMDAVPVAMLAGAAPGAGVAIPSAASIAPPPTLVAPTYTRAFFPETWLFRFLATDEQGVASLQDHVPDSITSWEVSAFAISPSQGLGAAPAPVEVTVLQQLFVAVDAPYKLVRGENASAAVSVFNYMGSEQRAVLSVSSSAANVALEQAEVVVPPNEMRTVRVWLQFTAVGQMAFTVTAQTTAAADEVLKQVLVVPDGTERAQSDSHLVDLLADGQVLALTSPSRKPADFVPGSLTASVRITGDLMGSPLENLDRLITLPYGCGEQTMLTMVGGFGRFFVFAT